MGTTQRHPLACISEPKARKFLPYVQGPVNMVASLTHRPERAIVTFTIIGVSPSGVDVPPGDSAALVGSVDVGVAAPFSHPFVPNLSPDRGPPSPGKP